MKLNDIILMYLLMRMVSVFLLNLILFVLLGLLGLFDIDVVGCIYKIVCVFIGEFFFI